MTGLDYKELDRWIADLDALQQELRTVKVKRSFSSNQQKSNGWTTSSFLAAQNESKPRLTQTLSFVPNRTANLTEMDSNQSEFNSEKTTPRQSPFAPLQPNNLTRKSSSPSRSRCSPKVVDYRSHVYESTPLENRLKVTYQADSMPYNPYVCIINRKNGSSTSSRPGTLREQKSVHWSSEINSAAASSVPKINTNKLVTNDRQAAQSPRNTMGLKGSHLRSDSAFPTTSLIRGRQQGPTKNSAVGGAARTDVIVTRSHSINPVNRALSHSETVPSRLAFPITLADFTEQKSAADKTRVTYQSDGTNQCSLKDYRPEMHSIPAAHLFSKMVSHTKPFSVSPSEQMESKLSTQGMVRSKSSVEHLAGCRSKNKSILDEFNLNCEYSNERYHGAKFQPQRSHSMHHDTLSPATRRSTQEWNPADLSPFKSSEVVPHRKTDRLILRVYHPNRTTKAVSLGPDTTTLQVIDILLHKSNLSWSTKYALVEKIPSMKLERCFEDDEILIDCLGNWTVGCENLVFFEEREDVYGMFENSQLWLGDKIVPSEYVDGENVVKEFFARNNEMNLPSISEYLYIQTKDSEWKRRFCLLRNSGLYISKQNSSSIAGYQRLVSFKPYLHLYTTTGGWSKMRAPTPYGFTVKSCSSKILDAQFTVHFCAPSESSLRVWYSFVRIALIGETLLRNYQRRQKLSNILGVPICRPMSLFSTPLLEYQKHVENKPNGHLNVPEFNSHPCQFHQAFQAMETQVHNAHLNKQTLLVCRPDPTGSRIPFQVNTDEHGKPFSVSSDSHQPHMCTDPDTTTGDASSIGWSTSGSGGCGPLNILNHAGKSNVLGGIGCVSGRPDVRAPRHSQSVSDLTRPVETRTQTQTNCAGSLTSLFSCTVNNDKRTGQQYYNISPKPANLTGRGHSKSLRKRLFGGGPSARRCNIGRSVSNISAPFNVSVPSWVRASMSDLTLQMPSAHPTI